MTELENDLREMFMMKYTLKEMQAVLLVKRRLELSIRTIRRKLERLGLKRNNAQDMNTVQAAICTEINGSGQRLGCRMMVHRLLNKHGISIGRDRVLQLLHIFDPEGVSLRRRNCLTRRQYHNAGPNFLVHIDGYDKLKNYGLAIHGAICGFSRKVLWLKVNRTNNDPDVVASYYIDFIRGLSGVPRCIRTDAGTENVTIINMQKALRWYHDDEQSGEKSVIVGSSHSNQRIEAWWRHLRQLCTGFWIDFFKDLDEQGLLSTAEPLHLECLRFCFTKILQQELDQVRTEWNNHRVRSSAESTTDGKPDLLYFYPELFGSKSYVYDVEPSDIDHLQLYTTKPGEYGCQDESAFHFLDLMRQNHKEMPSSSEEALAMYRWLMNNV